MYKLGRRNFVLTSALGLSTFNSTLMAQAKKQDKSVILIWLHGGLSHLGSFVMKPDAPENIRGTIRPIHTNTQGYYISEYLPKLAQNTDKFTVVQNTYNYNGSHGIAEAYFLTANKYVPSTFYPTYGSIVSKELGHKTQIPPFVQIGNSLDRQTAQGGTAGHLGSKFNPFKLDDDPNSISFKVNGITLPDGVDGDRLQKRFNLIQQSKNISNSDNIIAMNKFYDKALDLVLNKSTERVFNLNNENPKIRDMYGRNTFGQSCLLARRLVETGCRFVTVTDGGWDTHVNNDQELSRKLPILDSGYSTLLSDLHSRGMLDNTMVVLLTDFSRTSKINATNGRDHQIGVFTMVLSGGGFKHLGSYGQNDNIAFQPIGTPIYIEDFAHTMYKLIGINPEAEYIASDGRPFKILKDGRLLNELI